MSKLAEIFEVEKARVAEAKKQVSQAELELQIRSLPLTLGFQSSLENTKFDLALIAEVKAASPSAGTIRSDFDPSAIAMAYRSAGAECLSVLTNKPYFSGDPSYIEVCKRASGLPVLRKDFISDAYQIFEARAWGADAILLIVASLTATEIRELTSVAEDLGLDVLTEVHTVQEADTALECGCKMIGVNNRDLSTFQTSLSVSETILPLVAGHAFAVSESALESRRDLDRVRNAGARAVLIGTVFCSSSDIAAKVAEVTGR